MNAEDLRRLAERAETIEGRQGARLTELHGRIRTARRRRAVVGTAAATGLVVAVVSGGAVLNGSIDRTDPPVHRNPPEPKPTKTDDAQPPEPAGQTTIQAEIGPNDVQGWKLMASRTNTDPGYEGATDLSVSANVGGLYGTLQSFLQPFCNGDPNTSWVLITDLGGVDGEQNPDGSMGNGTRGMSGSCSEDGPTDVPAPRPSGIDPYQRDEPPTATPLRMFVTAALFTAAEKCLGGTTDTDSCLATHQIVPLDESDATFGVGVYEHRRAPIVMTVVGWPLQALAIADGVEYLVDRAVLPARGAPHLAVQLPDSDRRTVVAILQSETPALEECADGIDIDVVDPASEIAQQEAFQRRCVPVLELRVDGQLLPNEGYDSYFGQQQVVLPPGDAHEITVDVVKNDPANTRYALVIWEERS